MYWIKNEKGAILMLLVVAILVSLSGIVLAFMSMTSLQIKSTGVELVNMKAFYIAEAGRAKARRMLTTGGEAVGWGEADVSFGGGTYTVATSDNGNNTYNITSEGYVPDDVAPVAKRRVVEKNIPANFQFINLSLEATASASSTQGQNTANKANDGDASTRWSASGGDGSWLAMDLGSSKLFDRAVFNEFGDKIQTYTVQHSSDGASWTAVTNPVESVNGDITTVSFDSVTNRYFRLFINQTQNNPSIIELESYNIAGGQVLVLGKGKFVTSW